jgi:hypothetical protein
MEDIKTPDNIKKYFDPSWDENKSLPLTTFNSPFGIMTIIQSDNYPVAACAIKDLFVPSKRLPQAPQFSLPEKSCSSCQANLIRNPKQRKASLR